MRPTLRRLGCTGERAEDVLQDVAERLLSKDFVCLDQAHLTRFARHVARYMWIDCVRSADRRKTDVRANIDHAAADHADGVVESLTARRAWTLLRPTDRQTLLDAGDPAATTREYGRRFSARTRLLIILAALEAWMLWVQIRVRRLKAKPAIVATAAASMALTLAISTNSLPRSDGAELEPPHPDVASAAGGGSSHSETSRSSETTTGSEPRHTYRERIRVPARRLVVGPGPNGFVNADTEPTTEGDAVLCFGGVILIGGHCFGDAAHPLRVLPR